MRPVNNVDGLIQAVVGAARAAAVLVAVALASSGCTGTPEGPVSPPSLDETESTPAGSPEFRGRQPLQIAAGNAAYSADPCEPTAVRLCERDGVRGFILLGGSPEPINLTSIAMRPTRGATKWNVVLAMDDASAVRRAGQAAHSAGGLLLLLSPQGEVLTTIRIEVLPFETVRGARLRLFDMDKPEAWDLTKRLIDVLTEPTSLTP